MFAKTMRLIGTAVLGTLLLLIGIGIAYIFNGAGAKGAGPAIAGMAVTPALVLVFALPVAVLMILSMVLNRHR